MSRAFNGILGLAARQAASQATARWGLVEAFDPDTYTVRVRIQPEDRLTGWLPISTPLVGDGLGLMVGPTAGQQAFLVPQEGDAGSFVVTGFAFSDQSRVPESKASIRGQPVKVRPGEVAIVGPKGSQVRIAADGTIYMQGPVNMEGDLTVSGDIHCEQNVLADQNVEAKQSVKADQNVEAKADVKDAHGTLDELRQNYNQHKHTAGFGGQTGPTTKPD